MKCNAKERWVPGKETGTGGGICSRSPGGSGSNISAQAQRRPGRISIRRISPYLLDFLLLVYILSLIFNVPWRPACTLGLTGRTLFFSLFACFFSSLFVYHLFDDCLCFGYPFFEHDFCIDLSSILDWISVSLLMVCLIPFPFTCATC